MTLFDMDIGSSFRYRDEVFRLDFINDKTSDARAVRIGAMLCNGKVRRVGPLNSDAFNPYVEVELLDGPTLEWAE